MSWTLQSQRRFTYPFFSSFPKVTVSLNNGSVFHYSLYSFCRFTEAGKLGTGLTCQELLRSHAKIRLLEEIVGIYLCIFEHGQWLTRMLTPSLYPACSTSYKLVHPSYYQPLLNKCRWKLGALFPQLFNPTWIAAICKLEENDSVFSEWFWSQPTLLMLAFSSFPSQPRERGN